MARAMEAPNFPYAISQAERLEHFLSVDARASVYPQADGSALVSYTSVLARHTYALVFPAGNWTFAIESDGTFPIPSDAPVYEMFHRRFVSESVYCYMVAL